MKTELNMKMTKMKNNVDLTIKLIPSLQSQIKAWRCEINKIGAGITNEFKSLTE